VCERWLESFENFLADMGERPAGMTLDRYPDKNGNYEPGNVRWATDEKQSNNRRTNRLMTMNGETMTLSQWSRRTGIPQGTLRSRYERGWPVEKILTKQMKRGNF